MSKLLIEPHYFGCLEYFALIQNYEKIEFEVCDSFKKQTYRNRAYVLGANKVQSLNVPLKFSNGTPTKEVKVDYSQRWIKDHWGAIYSSYGKAPFFEFFADDFHAVWTERNEFLVDLNSRIFSLCLKILGIKTENTTTEIFEKEANADRADFRNTIQPKNPFSDRNIYRSYTYSQLFGDNFVPNLSIIDLIMCEGPRASEILASSYRGNK